jgi:hypothetical protein
MESIYPWLPTLIAVIGSVAGVIGFFLRNIVKEVNDNHNELSAYKTEVAEKYATRDSVNYVSDSIQSMMIRIDQKLMRIEDKLDEKADKP